MAHVLTKVEPSEATDTTEIAKIAEELGLEIQKQRYSVPHSIERDFTPMDENTLLVWRAYCPTAYVASEGGNSSWLSTSGEWVVERTRPMKAYQHDTIPGEVLRHWANIRRNYAFDTFEIRTTERTPAMHDPLLFGYFSGAVYLLARWGLESPESLPLREVARQVKERREREAPRQRFLWNESAGYTECPIWLAASRVLAAQR